MDREWLLEMYRQHRGKVWGVGLGLLFGLGVALMGLARTVFIALCIALGYSIGRRIDKGEDPAEWWERFFGRRG
ncbi:DUF2273 domain-containing protein [Thermanaeromonas sp. C210]|uniref:DUF2273 domain-containing protein n=1 Tax=Thermanaeromonas sp. C210 TaxID=2731925 RepID=UPI00155CCCD3|nr:DUF2273 domain-containing protein [Thermanaeromonas sp. C210]MBE3572309.1 DUF2273 domain-containing protein [Moorella humiferrea]GFN23319.1 hypothetical protein TAMC210_16360 [Thermanaeromonas sp. C210]